MLQQCIAKPFVKWAGGKTQILNEIRAKYPLELGARINKYAEPFVGGGAVLFDILNHYELNEIYINDINKELIFTYTTIRDSLNQLTEILAEIEGEYLPVDTEQRKKSYYSYRDRFNLLKTSSVQTPELAALFIFLNRTCFNGLYRVNAKGEYNVPQGSYKNPSICDIDNLRAVSEKLRRVEITHGDYHSAGDFIDRNTFAYFDPPYRPLSATSNFTAYQQDSFNDNAQRELARFIDEMSERGACVVASNSDPTNSDEGDLFFDNLYARHVIIRIKAGRAINSVGNGRGRIRELLIANGPREQSNCPTHCSGY
jgi:DNA adenine methylase